MGYISLSFLMCLVSMRRTSSHPLHDLAHMPGPKTIPALHSNIVPQSLHDMVILPVCGSVDIRRPHYIYMALHAVCGLCRLLL